LNFVYDTKENEMDKLIEEVNYLKNTMISVSTGGQVIQEVNNEYKKIYREVSVELKRLCKLPHFFGHSKLEFLSNFCVHFHRCFIV
jgi:hypothetical protein